MHYHTVHTTPIRTHPPGYPDFLSSTHPTSHWSLRYGWRTHVTTYYRAVTVAYRFATWCIVKRIVFWLRYQEYKGTIKHHYHMLRMAWM